jgi:hypothetical protein
MNPQHFDLAYEKLVDYLMHFCVSRIYGADNAAQDQPRTFGGHSGFVSMELTGDPTLQEGDLVLLSGHRQPKWRMGWLRTVRNLPIGAEYMVHSVMGDGEVASFTNVSVSYFHRPTLKQHPEWRWTNEQHGMADEWIQTILAERQTSLIVPMQPVFLGDSVTLKARARFGLDEFKPSITLADFRSLTKADLLSCYDALCQKWDTFRAGRRVLNAAAEPAS